VPGEREARTASDAMNACTNAAGHGPALPMVPYAFVRGHTYSWLIFLVSKLHPGPCHTPARNG